MEKKARQMACLFSRLAICRSVCFLLSNDKGLKSLPVYFAGFQDDQKAFRIGQADGLLERIHLLIIAGTHDHKTLILPIAALSSENCGASAAGFPDGVADKEGTGSDDESQLSGVYAVHGLIHHPGKKVGDDQAIDDAVHVAEKGAANQDDHRIGEKNDFPKGNMRLPGLHRQSDKIHSPGGGTLHEDQGVAVSCDHSRTDGGQQAASLVGRQQGGDDIHHHRRNHHAPQGAQKKILAQKPEAEKGYRNV